MPFHKHAVLVSHITKAVFIESVQRGHGFYFLYANDISIYTADDCTCNVLTLAVMNGECQVVDGKPILGPRVPLSPKIVTSKEVLHVKRGNANFDHGERHT